jgi:hypothetical protein
MTLTPDNDLSEISRQRTRDQFGLLQEAHRERILVDTDDPADFNFICSSEHVLVAPLDPNGADDDDAVNRLSAYLTDTRGGEFEPVPDQPEQTRTGLSRRFELPARTVPAPDGKDLLATLDEIDRDLGVGFATPDHLVHICVKGSICPASEPTETGFLGPWPQDTSDPEHGDGVRVVVIDTGWHDPTTLLVNPEPALPWSWLANVSGDPEPNGIVNPLSGNLRAYAGHGTFVAGVVRAMAPKAEVTVLNLVIDRQEPGGGVLESQLVDDLYDALEPDQMEELPHLINMSAGCPTRLGLQAQSFVHWRADLEQRHPDPDLVLVAAAGNNSSPWSFWPASFDWATGVGSLDSDGHVSEFSNWGDSVDVFALGRNVVNAFPNGTYVCHECPDRGDQRIFDNWLARWSGTSFSAPLVTGLIAAAMSRQQGQRSARAARDEVLDVTQMRPVPRAGLSALVPVLKTP